MRLYRIGLTWAGPGPEGLREAIEGWAGTPYLEDTQCPGVGVDCVRFVCAILDVLSGQSTDISVMPQDIALHSPEGARASMRQIMSNYRPYLNLGANAFVRGGDIVVVGHRDGGPGHAMIVGPDRNTLWHAIRPKVTMKGFTLPEDTVIYRVFRKEVPGGC